MNRLYLGIDGGQSSTTALISDSTGRILGRGRSGPCNHVSAGEAERKFRLTVGECLNQACEQAQLPADTVRFAAACLGFSGGFEDKQTYSRELIRSELWKFTHDAEIALTGALAGSPGIIVIAGTGSMAFGRNRHGATARAGGWGYLFGDEGGAFYLVREAVRSALRAEEDWGPSTTLTGKLLAATEAASVRELMHRWYKVPRADIAAFASLVSQAASEGDSIADEICRRGAQHLATYAGGVARNLFPEESGIAVSYAGGVFQSLPVLNAFERECRQLFAGQVSKPIYSPAAGALIEAFLLDNIPPSSVPSLDGSGVK